MFRREKGDLRPKNRQIPSMSRSNLGPVILAAYIKLLRYIINHRGTPMTISETGNLNSADAVALTLLRDVDTN